MPPEKSKGKSKRKTGTKKRKTPTVNVEKKEEKVPAIGRLDQKSRGAGGMEKLPSNAPTMAIAPSDYEHIYHEGPAGGGAGGGGGAAVEAAGAVTKSPQQVVPPVVAAPAPRVQIVQQNNQDYGGQSQEIQVTPDGYTMLGQPPLEMGATGGSMRKIALPPHVVRASNQFSRPVLARLARYLSSRAESN